MPELPEVETIVRDLRPLIVNRRIMAVQRSRKVLRKPWKTAWNTKLVGRLVDAVQRRGKWIVLTLSEGSCLVIHLGMTGQLGVAGPTEPSKDHTHLVFALDDCRELRFRDIRRFGSASFFADQSEVDMFFQLSRLGPEPFAIDKLSWQSQLARTNRCLKAVLLDQRVVAGIGNIYADESLFEARLHPTRLANGLNAVEATRLRKAIGVVLRRAIDRRGSSIRDYVGGSGLRGGYQDEFRVYGRKGEPCRRCGSAIVRIRLAGRATHYCPTCQVC